MTNEEARQIAAAAIKSGALKGPTTHLTPHQRAGLLSANKLTPRQRTERARHTGNSRWKRSRRRVVAQTETGLDFVNMRYTDL
jgi:hypothetical protein